MTPKRLTQRDLARLAGVSAMTVSLALRGHPSIPAATRDRIRALADQHAYRPDPALAALNAYRAQARPRQFQGTLAWLTSFPSADGWRDMIHLDAYFEGAETRAGELGYRLENFWLSEPGLTAKRAARILLTRGVQGLIAAPLPAGQSTLALDWSPFSAVALGYSLRRPQLHVVMNHQSRNMKQTVHQLRALGCQRIGLALPSANNARVDQNYLSGYLIAQRECGGAPLEPLLADVFTAPVFRAWLRRQRPDALVISPAWVEKVSAWLEAEGLHVPRDVSLAAASIPDGASRLSGIAENPRLIGAMAVDALIGMIHRHERGVPAHPWSLLTEGRWQAGKTTARRAPRASRTATRPPGAL